MIHTFMVTLDVSETNRIKVQNQLTYRIKKLVNDAASITKKEELLVSIGNDDGITLAKEYIETNIEAGCICPVCERYIKRYRRKLTSSMAHALMIIYNSGNRDFIHIAEFLKKKPCPSSIYGDVSKFRFWGILERQEGEREDGNPNVGYYKITQKGIDFVLNRIKVPKHIVIEKNEMVGESDELISISEALGQRFNYSELLNEYDNQLI